MKNDIHVPYFSSKLIPIEVKERWLSAMKNSIEDDSFILGDSVTKFEMEFANYIGVSHAVGVSNGLDGLILSLKAMGILPGDYVAVPSHTFIATWLAVIHVGAIPIEVEVNDCGLVDVPALQHLRTTPKALIVVHMHGAVCNMGDINSWAKSNNVLIVEDASQSHGAELNGKKTGSLGDIGVFSLYPTKNLGGLGDGGIVTTDNENLSNRIKCLRNYGSDSKSKYIHNAIGYNNRLDTLQAAFLSISLEYLDRWNSHRRELAEIYQHQFQETGIQILQTEHQESVFHHFPILVPNRDRLREYLKFKGIDTEIHYPRLASSEIYSILGNSNQADYQGSRISATTLSLPLSQYHTATQIEYVAEVVVDYLKSNGS